MNETGKGNKSNVDSETIKGHVRAATTDLSEVKRKIDGFESMLTSKLDDLENLCAKYNDKYVKGPRNYDKNGQRDEANSYDEKVVIQADSLAKAINDGLDAIKKFNLSIQSIEGRYDAMTELVGKIGEEIDETAADARDGIDSYDTGSGNNAFGGGSSSSSPGMGNTGSSGYDNAGGSWNGSGEDGYFEDDGSYGEDMSGGGMSGGGMSGDDYSSGMNQQSTYTPVDYEKYDPSKYNTSLSTSASNAAKSIVPTAVGAGVAGAVSDLASSVKDKDSYSTTSKYKSDDEYKKKAEDNKSNKNSNSDSYSASRYGAGSYGGYSGSSNDVVNAVEAASNNVLPDPINPIAPNTEYAAIPNTGATQPIIHTYKKNKAGTTLTAALFGLGAAGGIIAKKVKDNKEKNENTENEEENYDDVVQSYDNLEDEII